MLGVTVLLTDMELTPYNKIRIVVDVPSTVFRCVTNEVSCHEDFLNVYIYVLHFSSLQMIILVVPRFCDIASTSHVVLRLHGVLLKYGATFLFINSEVSVSPNIRMIRSLTVGSVGREARHKNFVGADEGEIPLGTCRHRREANM
jgi:hypothetical protein